MGVAKSPVAVVERERERERAKEWSDGERERERGRGLVSKRGCVFRWLRGYVPVSFEGRNVGERERVRERRGEGARIVLIKLMVHADDDEWQMPHQMRELCGASDDACDTHRPLPSKARDRR